MTISDFFQKLNTFLIYFIVIRFVIINWMCIERIFRFNVTRLSALSIPVELVKNRRFTKKNYLLVYHYNIHFQCIIHITEVYIPNRNQRRSIHSIIRGVVGRHAPLGSDIVAPWQFTYSMCIHLLYFYFFLFCPNFISKNRFVFLIAHLPTTYKPKIVMIHEKMHPVLQKKLILLKMHTFGY